MHDLRYPCLVIPLDKDRVVALLIRTGKSRVVSYYSRDIGSGLFTTHCNHKDYGPGQMVDVMVVDVYGGDPICLVKRYLRPQMCGTFVKCLNVLATCREIW